MEMRIFGRTKHASTVAIFGAFALGRLTQDEADAAMQQVLEAGVNHVDVAPSYYEAEARLGSWIARHDQDFFLGCKTMERSSAGAGAELRRSLERLHVSRFDLYQFHAVNSMAELDQVTAPGGALEAVVEARSQGLTRFIGITGHGLQAPEIFIEALRRFPFDSVLFPVNFKLYADPVYRAKAIELLALCHARTVGVMAIKSITKGPWNLKVPADPKGPMGERTPEYHTWYEPFNDEKMIQKTVNFTLSQDVTGICTAGDARLLPLVLQACERFHPLTRSEQEHLLSSAGAYEPLFT